MNDIIQIVITKTPEGKFKVALHGRHTVLDTIEYSTIEEVLSAGELALALLDVA